MRGAGITRAGDGAVRAQAGATVNGLVRWTVANGLTGLETWAGTPGTVGGAISGNAHFDGRSIGDRVLRAAVVSRAGVAAELVHDELAFGYDDSRLRHTGEILVWAEFRVESGNPVRLRDTARQSLHYRKRTQPLALPSAGCIFQNPDPARVQIPEGVPSSAGALIDRAGLKGARQGGALVSPTHANFIVNAGGATAADIRTLIERCRTAVRQQFGIELEEEIVCLGEF
jgi:UDP-N-acetylmuramate dehydrogenase